MNPVYRRASSFSANSGSALTNFREDEDYVGSYSHYVPIRNDYGDDEFYHRPRQADNYYGIRQEYLRSYTFTREEPKPEKKLKGSLKRIKTVAWAVLCCKYRPEQARALRERLSSTSSRFFHRSTEYLCKSSRFFHERSDYLSTSCRNLSVPSCIHFAVSK